jgi:hypothetical protein
VSVRYEYSAGAPPRSGLLPRKTIAMENMAAAGNILSRSLRWWRQLTSLRTYDDGIFTHIHRYNFRTGLSFCARRQKRWPIIDEKKRILFPV